MTRLYLYYDMKLVMFGIDNKKDLIVQFPVFVQPYTQSRLIRYQIETVPVLILDQNEQVQSYTQLKVDKPYIASNTEAYITLRTQELHTCKKIGYEYYCQKQNLVLLCQCIYFNLGPEIIKENCEFKFYFNKTNVKPAMLDGGPLIILANWPSYKKIMCTYNNNILVNIPRHQYVLMNGSILCNCNVEAESNFLLEPLAACENLDTKADLEMYFTANLAFVYYFKKCNRRFRFFHFDNWTTQEQILPISIETFEFNPKLLSMPKMLKDFVT